jgi:hypothetical protein
MSLASIGNAVEAGLATMPVLADLLTLDGSVTAVAGSAGFDATGAPSCPLLVHPATDATIAAAITAARIDGRDFGSGEA